MNSSKICCCCKSIKTLEEFHNNKNLPDGKTKTCKECKNKQHKRDYSAERDYARKLKYRYGISVEQYEELRLKQNNKCAICNKFKDKLQVDHCHTTGKVRGLLCRPCNTSLGIFGDTVEGLKKVLKYLE